MESLKMYIKDKSFIVSFYNIGFLAGILFIFISNVDLFSESITKIAVKGLILIPFIPLAGWYFLSLAKDLISVFLDYKKPILLTSRFTIKNVGYAPCFEYRNGAYFFVEFSDEKKQFWIYRKSQIYSDFVRGEEYEVTYYKNSRCIHTIKRLSFNFEGVEALERRKKKKIKRKKQKNSFKKNPFETFISNYLDGFVLNVFLLLILPFYLMLYDFLKDISSTGIYEYIFGISVLAVIFFYSLILRIVIKRITSYIYYKKGITKKIIATIDSIPSTKKFLMPGKMVEMFLFVIDENKKKSRYRFYSAEILGLGDLCERPGYMGYGNFIGTKYEIEYYLFSNVIKSMKRVDCTG